MQKKMANSESSLCVLSLLMIILCVLGPQTTVSGLSNSLARTPPMGWMAWERFECTVDCKTYPNDCVNDELFKQMADTMVKNGYQAAGYKYVNIDDCWSELERDKDGNLQANSTRFPDGIQSLANYIHSKGLLLSIYGDCGTLTCARYPAQLKSNETNLEDNYFDIDAKQFANWQVDSLKFDGCYLAPEKQESICPKMADALEKSNRPILLICEYPFYMLRANLEPIWKTVADKCNTWRYYEDVEDSWLSILNILDFTIKWQSTMVNIHGPGHWFDPDQLVIGNYALSKDQARAQMALWCLWSAPLYMGNDLRAISPEMHAILTNKKLIQVDQDRLGILGMFVARHQEHKVDMFVKPVEPGAHKCPSFVVLYLSRATEGNARLVSFSVRELLNQSKLILLAEKRQDQALEEYKTGLGGREILPSETINAKECNLLIDNEPFTESFYVKKSVTFSVEDLFEDYQEISYVTLDSNLTLRVNPSGVRMVKLTITDIEG